VQLEDNHCHSVISSCTDDYLSCEQRSRRRPNSPVRQRLMIVPSKWPSVFLPGPSRIPRMRLRPKWYTEIIWNSRRRRFTRGRASALNTSPFCRIIASQLLFLDPRKTLKGSDYTDVNRPPSSGDFTRIKPYSIRESLHVDGCTNQKCTEVDRVLKGHCWGH